MAHTKCKMYKRGHEIFKEIGMADQSCHSKADFKYEHSESLDNPSENTPPECVVIDKKDEDNYNQFDGKLYEGCTPCTKLLFYF